MEKAELPKVVLDTNLLISAAIADGYLPGQILSAWKNNQFDLVLTKQIITEIVEVAKRDRIKTKYPLFSWRVGELIKNLELSAEIVDELPQEELLVHCRDPKDDKLLACAFGGEADYLVTFDEDLLALKDRQELVNMKIVAPDEFLSLLRLDI